uniref:RNA helicase n=1 Tax=Panagrolaimus sp. ES5 TaxID=591445 RepID=A0AC34FDE3_9BILA
MSNFGRGGSAARPSPYSSNNDRYDRQDRNQQFSTAQSTNEYDDRRGNNDRRPPPPPINNDRRPPPQDSDRRPPPQDSDRRPPPSSNDRRPPPPSVGGDNYDRQDRGRRFDEALNGPDYQDFGRSSNATTRGPPPPSSRPANENVGYFRGLPPVLERFDRQPPQPRTRNDSNEYSNDVRQTRNNPPPRIIADSRNEEFGSRSPRLTVAADPSLRNPNGGNPRGALHSGPTSRPPYDSNSENLYSRDSRPNNSAAPPRRGGYGNADEGRLTREAPYSGRDDYPVQRPAARNEMNRDYDRAPYAERDRNYSRSRDSDRTLTPPRRDGYGNASRDDDRYSNAPTIRSRDDYGPPSRNASDSRSPFPSRGRGAPRGGHDRSSNNGDRYSSTADRGYSGRQDSYGPSPSTRGGRSYETNSRYNQSSDAYDYGSRGGRDERSSYSNNPPPTNGYSNDRSSGFPGGFSTRGGGNFSSGGRGGGSVSRYEDRRNNENSGYGGYNAGGGGGGYGGYSGFGSGFDDGRKERTAENHAPRDFKPTERDIQDIFNEDKEDVKKNTATIFDADADVKIEETTEYLHCDTWAEMKLHPSLMENIINSDYTRPRKIQQKTIPYVLDGFDVKCQGETGSGKTAAFLIPVIQKLIEENERGQLSRDGPICLIVAPTRELVSQIYEQAKKFTYNTEISVARAYGEYNMHQNRADIRRGCNILCGCIGRLMHFIEEGDVKVDTVKYLILDEADRMLMERNNSDIIKLFNYPELPDKDKRQTLLFSATLRDPMVMDLTKIYMNSEKSVLITATCQSNKRVNYKVFAVPSAPSKYRYLVKYMKKITEENGSDIPRTLIFVNKKVNTDRVAVELTSAGFPATTIHGDRGQHLREEALRFFRSGKTRCLVATDVCARGVDIKEMDHVINFELPTDKDGFIQRSGRTGRTHNGTAMSFYLESDDRSIATDIARIIQQNDQEAPGFLDSYVTESDYNFGEGSEATEPESNNDNGYGSNGNGYDRSNNGYGNSSTPPPYHANSREASVANPQRQPTPPAIPDSTADDEWD